MSAISKIRNFCIIAHIDHGKSTLADRLLEATGTTTPEDMKAQLLDDMDLEREKGITIKSHAIQMKFKEWELNLIDTPGHVDFSYEVSRAIASSEGALLIVDAAQGIEAQTLSNLYLALEHDLEIIPIINKIDLASARLDEVKAEIQELMGCSSEDILLASAKDGIGIPEILKAIIHRIPPPKGNPAAPLQAMIFDSFYNPYRGVVVLFRVFEGTFRKEDRIRFVHTQKEYEVDEIGILGLEHIPSSEIGTGSVGYLVSGIKKTQEVRVGDTLTHAHHPAAPLRGFQQVKPMVFAGIYPIVPGDFEDLRASLEKLSLNDASLMWEPETSSALGFGFRCGFLGLLHMEIVQERLEREFQVSVITTVPSVQFRVISQDGQTIEINTPADLPESQYVKHIEEPYVRAQIMTTEEYLGPIMEICIGKRGSLKKQVYLGTKRVELVFDMPLVEIVMDFYDRLKTVSRGYASLDYDWLEYRIGNLVKLDILLNKERVDALSCIVHREKSYEWGKRLCEKLKDFIPRQMFDVAIQAAIGSRVMARETVKAMRKNVTAKCYGGDITRKRKLLEKQKKGKKKMRQVGNVEIPQEAFSAVLKLD
ncbi:MAG: translation elongation factor 4 [Cytophagales bacterium]|nr:translation elongation factor 4 [Cytophagales bacterium]